MTNIIFEGDNELIAVALQMLFNSFIFIYLSYFYSLQASKLGIELFFVKYFSKRYIFIRNTLIIGIAFAGYYIISILFTLILIYKIQEFSDIVSACIFFIMQFTKNIGIIMILIKFGNIVNSAYSILVAFKIMEKSLYKSREKNAFEQYSQYKFELAIRNMWLLILITSLSIIYSISVNLLGFIQDSIEPFFFSVFFLFELK